MTSGFRLFQLFEFFQEDWDIRREDQTDIRVWEVSDPVYIMPIEFPAKFHSEPNFVIRRRQLVTATNVIQS
jgi:hypothetical protein